MSASPLPLPLLLSLTQHTRWTAVQESALQTYPFSPEHQAATECQDDVDNVVRVYLQFLWLPESVMPLSLFVPAIGSASLAHSSSHSPTSLHPLHGRLEPLIMTPRAASNKYYADLSQILADGGGAGEIEEHMMWFALSFEKDLDDVGGIRDSHAGSGERGDEETEPWRNEQWRRRWLEKMERREVQIQVLLHFLKLCLPGPTPPDVKEKVSASARMPPRPYLSRASDIRNARKEGKDVVPTLSIREILEVYMDKMSTWQLLYELETSAGNTKKDHGDFIPLGDQRDWVQAFVEDVVEKQFRPYLPDLCDLFREKVFPASVFSDEDEDLDLEEVRSIASTRSNSPVESEFAPTVSRSVSTSSSLKQKGDISQSRLSRSRSLSVSLQQERESQRDASNQQKNKKRSLNREVSMSFRAKSKAPTPGPERPDLSFGTAVGLRGQGQKSATNGKGKAKATGGKNKEEITLVEATPVKNRIKSFSTASMMSLGKSLTSKASAGEMDVDADIWESELPKSGDIIMKTAGGDEDEVVLVAETPKKIKARTRVVAGRV